MNSNSRESSCLCLLIAWVLHTTNIHMHVCTCAHPPPHTHTVVPGFIWMLWIQTQVPMIAQQFPWNKVYYLEEVLHCDFSMVAYPSLNALKSYARYFSFVLGSHFLSCGPVDTDTYHVSVSFLQFLIGHGQ